MRFRHPHVLYDAGFPLNLVAYRLRDADGERKVKNPEL
jgi:hypothetical protein